MSDNTVTVPVKDALTSKINWTQVIQLLFGVLTMAGVVVPDDLKSQILTLILVVGNIITIVMKTWFSASVTAQSVGQK